METHFEVGDYIGYIHESYNGGYHRIDRTTYYGYIIEKNEDSYNIIKQFGGQIWYGVEPICKITEETFLKNFVVYNDFFSNLFKNKDKINDKLNGIIENKYHERVEKVKKAVTNYVNKHMNKDENKENKFNPETYYIEWYVHNILRMYEPYKIKQTLTYCYGASEELQTFMNDNTEFMIDMQFLHHNKEHLMTTLIEKKLTDYKNKKE